jgi:hypothetical protein
VARTTMNSGGGRRNPSRGCNGCKIFRSKPLDGEFVEPCLARGRTPNAIGGAAGLDEMVLTAS